MSLHYTTKVLVISNFRGRPFTALLLILLFTLPSTILSTINGVSHSLLKTISIMQSTSNYIIVVNKQALVDLGELLGTLPPFFPHRVQFLITETKLNSIVNDLRERGLPVSTAYCVLELTTWVVGVGPLSRYMACENYYIWPKLRHITVVEDSNITNITKIFDIKKEYEALKRFCLEGKGGNPYSNIGFLIYVIDAELLEKGFTLGEIPFEVIVGHVPKGYGEILLPIVYKYNNYPVKIDLNETIPLVLHVGPAYYINVTVRVAGFIPEFRSNIIVTTFKIFEDMFNLSKKMCNIIVFPLSTRLNLERATRLVEIIREYFVERFGWKDIRVSYPWLLVERVYRGRAFTLMVVGLLSRVSPLVLALIGVLAGYMVFVVYRGFVRLLSSYGWGFSSCFTPLALVFLSSIAIGFVLAVAMLVWGWGYMYTGLASMLGFSGLEAELSSEFARAMAWRSMVFYVASTIASGLLTLSLLVLREVPLGLRREYEA